MRAGGATDSIVPIAALPLVLPKRDHAVCEQLIYNAADSSKTDAALVSNGGDGPRSVDEIQHAKQRPIAFRVLVGIDVNTEAGAEQFTLELVHWGDVLLQNLDHVQNHVARVFETPPGSRIRRVRTRMVFGIRPGGRGGWQHARKSQHGDSHAGRIELPLVITD